MRKSDLVKWNARLTRYKANCEEICKISRSIRYVGIINSHGRTLAGKIQHGTKPLFSPNQVRNEFFAIVTYTKLRKQSLSAIGELDYIIFNHKKVIILIFQNKDIVYYITFGSKSNPNKSIIQKIRKVITEE
tara:strand:+ start:7813 stop:8208 length:396 start_codon:yes stop_codon:yes gene_type:complete